MSRFSDPELLAPEHELGGFDCGKPSLDTWLVEHARQAAAMDSAKTHVIRDADQDGRVVAFHALAGASIGHGEAIKKVARGMPKHPIPAVLLARLAVDESVKGRGLGSWLLQDAAKRAIATAEAVGIRVMLVHALDDEAAAFYRHFGFQPSPTDPMNLQRTIKDLRASLEAAVRRGERRS